MRIISFTLYDHNFVCAGCNKSHPVGRCVRCNRCGQLPRDCKCVENKIAA